MAAGQDETRADPLPSALPVGELPPGTVLNGVYRIEARLGAGGMGEVYRATNLANDEVDAIKIIGRGMANQTVVEAMFRKEARVLARIHSPAVARLKLFMRDPALDLLYFVTEFVPGESLLDRLGRQPATGDELHTLMRRVLTGLQAVHEAGAVHRDLSPDNIILPGGDVTQAKIIDFGIAKELDPAHTTIIGDAFAGKLGYIAPEQLGFSGAEIGPWTDLYSLALVGVAFAAGKPLDMGATVGRAEEARRGPIDLSAVPGDLRPVFERLLTYDWRARPPSAAAVLAMLEGGLAPAPAPPPPAPVPPVTTVAPAAGRSVPWLLLAGVICLILIAAGLVITMRPAPTLAPASVSPVPRPSAAAPTSALPRADATVAASQPPPALSMSSSDRPAFAIACGPAIKIAFGPNQGGFPDGAQILIHGALDRIGLCHPAGVIVTGRAQTSEANAFDLARQRAAQTIAELRKSGVPPALLSTKLHVATPDLSTPLGRYDYQDAEIGFVDRR